MGEKAEVGYSQRERGKELGGRKKGRSQKNNSLTVVEERLDQKQGE